MKFDLKATITRSSDPVETTVGHEIVLMTLDAGECLGLGETGSDVWRLLERPATFPSLVAALRQTYQAPPGVIEADLAELLQQMLDRKLIALQL